MKKKRDFFRTLMGVLTVIILSAACFTGCLQEGATAYDIAVAGGFPGTQQEWLESLQGKSAYDIAVEKGFSGTEEEWLESLKPAATIPLLPKSAYDIAIENGFTGTEAEWLFSLSGKSAYETAVANGYKGTETEWADSLKIGDVALEELYEFYKIENPEVTLDEFVTKFFAFQHDPSSVAAQTALRSAVSIRTVAPGTTTVMAGAGVILDVNYTTGVAYIVTNYHVLYENGLSIDIRLCPFGKEFFSADLDFSVKADFVGGSVIKDIALLKTRASETFKSTEYRAAVIADSNKANIGETVIAVGNPDGAGLSATKGVLSVDSEYIELAQLNNTLTQVAHRVFRIDAAINGGNSGGGLFNINGELIGIVNAKMVDVKIDNIGYAIPSNIALGIVKSVMDESKQDGKFVKYLIGITTQIMDSHAVLKEGTMRIQETLEVVKLEPDAPSQGIVQLGDVVLSAKLGALAEIEVTRNFMLSDYLYAARPGDELVLTVLRGGVNTVLEPIIISASSYTDL